MKNCRLIYRSVSTEEIPSNEDLLKLSEEASANNLRDGITGLLVLSGSEFLQVLEGPVAKVNALFQKISRDPRHHTVELIFYEEVSETYFGNWDMRMVDLHDLPKETRRIFMEKYQHEDGIVSIPSKPQLTFALLLDVKAICLNKAWK